MINLALIVLAIKPVSHYHDMKKVCLLFFCSLKVAKNGANTLL
ncbi:hypothetical protein KKH3_15850 [Pectobacterium actinidiae]|nr:hypothetical protein KKH3_15850 [Pectobacterium actinidiae]